MTGLRILSVLAAVSGMLMLPAAVGAHTPHVSAAPPAASPAMAEPPTLRHFRRWTPDVAGPGWREANDEMARLGGHVGHLTRRPGAAPTPPGAAGAPPAAPPRHHDHHPHGGPR